MLSDCHFFRLNLLFSIEFTLWCCSRADRDDGHGHGSEEDGLVHDVRFEMRLKMRLRQAVGCLPLFCEPITDVFINVKSDKSSWRLGGILRR